jgi:hypothetical protein
MKLLQQKFAAELKEQTGPPIAFTRQEASTYFLATRGVGQCLSGNCCPANTEKPVSPDSPCVNRTASKTGQIAPAGGTGPFFTRRRPQELLHLECGIRCRFGLESF